MKKSLLISDAVDQEHKTSLLSTGSAVKNLHGVPGILCPGLHVFGHAAGTLAQMRGGVGQSVFEDIHGG